jgi:FkbM family methyltransferase
MIKDKIREFIYKRYNISFSKSGDDIQLLKLIKESSPGLYVDIGSWHPVKASNTYFFYLRGWKGICIDPNPELIDLYTKVRPKDLFLNSALGDSDLNLNYYMLTDAYSSMNTLNYDFIVNHKLEKEVKEVKKIPVYHLKSLLEQHVKPTDRLDFFDIDVEGYDLQVLKTNDWNKFRPKIIVIETDIPIQKDINSPETQYLSEQRYRLLGKSIINQDLGNLFFIDDTL